MGVIGTLAILGTAIPLKIGYLTSEATQTKEAPSQQNKLSIGELKTSGEELESQQDIKLAISSLSAEYGLDYKQFYETIKCESGFKADPPGNLLSRGVAQFTLPTWLGYCSEKDERLDALKALRCASKMWQKGLQFKWDCWCMTFGKENLECIKRGFK